jgi:hypothetical protein
MSVGRDASIACDRRHLCPLDRLLQSRDLCLCVFANFLTKRSCRPCSISDVVPSKRSCDRSEVRAIKQACYSHDVLFSGNSGSPMTPLLSFCRNFGTLDGPSNQVRVANCLRVSLRSTSFAMSGDGGRYQLCGAAACCVNALRAGNSVARLARGATRRLAQVFAARRPYPAARYQACRRASSDSAISVAPASNLRFASA